MPSADPRIKIPDFMSPWPSKQHGWPWEARMHIDSQSIIAESEQWVRAYEGVDGTLVDKIMKGRFPEIACLAWGHQTREQCLLAALVMFHFWVVEEVTDHEDEASVREKADAMTQALQHPGSSLTAPLPVTEWVGVRMAADITTKYKAIGTYESWKFYVDTFVDYLDAVVGEVAVRNKPISSRADYLRLRVNTIGILPGIALALIDCDLQPDFLELNVVKSLMSLTVLIMIHQNDLYSFDKEQAQGDDSHNGVRVLMEERKIGVQEAMDYLGGETTDLMREFVYLCENLPTLKDERNNQHLRVLRDGCISWIIGIEVWYTQVTMRYGMQRLDKDRTYIPTKI
ncbi:terpenoid synthase [Apiospora kogelbergensis]|uniref:terpenoid synthase n=1 Tax=Apiospora kogelbergensis TaxID=1337665 RepID=UPI00312DB38C